MNKNKLFKAYSDDQHGWLAVKKSDLEALAVKGISRFSYVKGQTVYLEEDCDLTLFIKAFEAKFGIPPQIKTIRVNGSSPIRSYERYSSRNETSQIEAYEFDKSGEC